MKHQPKDPRHYHLRAIESEHAAADQATTPEEGPVMLRCAACSNQEADYGAWRRSCADARGLRTLLAGIATAAIRRPIDSLMYQLGAEARSLGKVMAPKKTEAHIPTPRALGPLANAIVTSLATDSDGVRTTKFLEGAWSKIWQGPSVRG